jgi:hypothetical protein
MKILYKVSTFLILALGIVHLCMSPVLFSGFTSAALWFVSGGVMIVFLSFFNFILMSDAGKERLVKIFCNIANLTGLVFAGAMLILETRRARPGLSSWLVLAVLVFETIAAFRYSLRPQLSRLPEAK